MTHFFIFLNAKWSMRRRFGDCIVFVTIPSSNCHLSRAIVFDHSDSRPLLMPNHLSLLLTSPSNGLLADIAHRRPEWTLFSLTDRPPAQVPSGKVWGFVDWLCPSMSGLELCRRLREAETTRQGGRPEAASRCQNRASRPDHLRIVAPG